MMLVDGVSRKELAVDTMIAMAAASSMSPTQVGSPMAPGWRAMRRAISSERWRTAPVSSAKRILRKTSPGPESLVRRGSTAAGSVRSHQSGFATPAGVRAFVSSALATTSAGGGPAIWRARPSASTTMKQMNDSMTMVPMIHQMTAVRAERSFFAEKNFWYMFDSPSSRKKVGKKMPAAQYHGCAAPVPGSWPRTSRCATGRLAATSPGPIAKNSQGTAISTARMMSAPFRMSTETIDTMPARAVNSTTKAQPIQTP